MPWTRLDAVDWLRWKRYASLTGWHVGPFFWREGSALSRQALRPWRYNGGGRLQEKSSGRLQARVREGQSEGEGEAVAMASSSSSSRESRRSQVGSGEQQAPLPYRVRPYAYRSPVMCQCNQMAPCWTAWSDENPGRRYYRRRYGLVRNFWLFWFCPGLPSLNFCRVLPSSPLCRHRVIVVSSDGLIVRRLHMSGLYFVTCVMLFGK